MEVTMEMLRRMEPIALIIVFLGALNWGILGITGGETNVLAEVFGTGTFLDVLYVVVGISTGGDAEIVDIGEGVRRVVAASGADEALVTVFVRGSTAAITTMEYEPGGVHDLQALLDRLVPQEGDYEHNRLNHDTNSHAHQRASLVGASESVPVVGGSRPPGTRQQTVLVHFDD